MYLPLDVNRGVLDHNHWIKLVDHWILTCVSIIERVCIHVVMVGLKEKKNVNAILAILNPRNCVVGVIIAYLKNNFNLQGL